MRHGYVLGFIALLLIGCSSSTDSPFIPSASTVWVVNSLGETLTKVNPDSGSVQVNALPLGSAPNDIAVFQNRAYVVNSLSNNVQILDLTTEQTVGTIEIYLGLNPYNIVVENEQRAFVSNWLTGNVSVLNLTAAVETDTLATGGVPQGLCIASGRLFVTDVNLDLGQYTYGPGRLLAYNLATLEFVNAVTVGINPQVVLPGPDGHLHVVCTGEIGADTGQVMIVDPLTLSVIETIQVGGSPGSLAFNSRDVAYLGSVAWAGAGWLLTYDAMTHQVLRGTSNPILLPSSAMDVVCAGNDHIFAACFNEDALVELNEADSLIHTYTVGDGPVAAAIYSSEN
jgi:YVTN family beta-propeller protein